MARSFSLPALTVLGLEPPDLISCAADAGYDHVGLRLIPATDTDRRYPVIGDTPMVRELERRLADRGLSVLDVEVFRLKPETDIRGFAAVLDTAARLGARELLATGQDPDLSRLADTFGRLCDLAEPLGLHVNLEFMPWTEVDSLSKALTVLRAADRPNAGLIIDPLHVDRCRTPIEELRAIPKALLRYYQLCDGPGERPDDIATMIHQARQARDWPGEGGIALAPIIRALPPDIPVSLEVPSAGAENAVERARRGRIIAQSYLEGLA